jgi:hypothetical protein
VFNFPGYKRCKSKQHLKFHLTQLEWPHSKAITRTNAGEDEMKQEYLLMHCWWECKLVQPLWEAVWTFLKKLKIKLPCDPVKLLLGIYPKKCKSGCNTDTCTWMFTAALFTIAKLWRQPRCPTTDKWIKKMWYIYTMDFTQP